MRGISTCRREETQPNAHSPTPPALDAEPGWLLCFCGAGVTVHVQVRHVSASGRCDEGWEYVPSTQRIEARVRQGNASLSISVLVCSRERPVLGAAPLVRLDNETWRVQPSRFVRCWPHRQEVLEAIHCPIGDTLDPGQQLSLTNAPTAVSDLLETL